MHIIMTNMQQLLLVSEKNRNGEDKCNSFFFGVRSGGG